MSCLIVDELYTGIKLTQDFYISRDIDLASIRVGIYKHMAAQGDIVLKIKQDNVTLIESRVVTSSEINSEISEDYAYGLIKFEFDKPFVNLHVREGEKKTKYQFEIESSAGDTTNFIGLYRQWTDKIYKICENGEEMDEAPNDMVEPYMYEIYEYKYV